MHRPRELAIFFGAGAALHDFIPSTILRASRLPWLRPSPANACRADGRPQSLSPQPNGDDSENAAGENQHNRRSVIKPHAVGIKAWRTRAKGWRKHSQQVVGFASDDRAAAFTVATATLRSRLTRFSTPVTARHTNSSAATPSDQSATMATLGRPVQTAPDTEPIPPSPGRSPVDRRASFRRRLPQDVRNRLTLRLGSNRHQLRPRLRTVRNVGATRGTKCAASSSVPTLRELDAVVAHAVAERMVAI